MSLSFFNKLSTPVRIMPLGDSITRGLTIPGPIPGGYRTRLFKRLTEELFGASQVNFVGTQDDNSDPDNLPVASHEGRGGWRIDEHLLTIEDAVRETQPEIVLLHLGTNDVVQNFHVDDAPARLDRLIGKILHLSADTSIIVAQIIDSTDGPTHERIIDFNRAILPLLKVRKKAGQRVSSVNMFHVISLENFADPYHPNKNGYDQIADAWFEAIQSLVSETLD